MWETIPKEVKDIILKYSDLAEAKAYEREERPKDESWFLLGHTIQYGADKLIPYAAVILGLSPAELIERVEVSVSRKPAVNGEMIFSRLTGTCKIYLYTGLTYFYPAIAKILVTKMGVKSKGEIIEEPLSLPDRGYTARKLFLSFWDGNSHKEYVEQVWNIFELDEVRLKEAIGLASYCKYFVIAHELGHAIPAFLESGIGTSIGIETLFGANWHKALETSDREILADQIGVLLFSGLCHVEQNEACLLWGWIASQLVFVVEDMLRDFHRRQFGSEPASSSSHPPSALRLKFIRASLTQNQHYIEIGQAFEKICADILAETYID